MAITDQGTLTNVPGGIPINTGSWAQAEPTRVIGTDASTQNAMPVQTAPAGYTATAEGVYRPTGSTYTPTNQPVSITAGSLSPANPINVPQPQNTAGTAAQGVIGASKANAIAATDNLQALRDSEQKKLDAFTKERESMNPLLRGAGEKLGTQGQIAQDEANRVGLEARGEKARLLSNEYTRKQLQYNQVIESIYNDPRQTSEQKASALQQIEKTHAFDLTDLAIREHVANSDYQALRDSVDKRTQLLYGDIKDRYAYLKDLDQSVKDDMTKSEERVYNTQLKEAERANAKVDDFEKTQATALATAVSQEAPASVIEAISKATNKEGVIAAAGKYITDQLDRDVKKSALLTDELQREKLRADIAKTLAETKADSPEAIKATKQNEVLDLLSLTDDIIKSPYMGQVFGVKNPFTYWTPGTNEQMVKNQVKQLQSNLALDAREKLKGSGAISDFEAKILGRSVTALSPSLSNEAAKKELARIKGVLSTAAGLPALVQITDPSTGNSVTVQATRETINQAIIDGATVDYK